MQQEILSAYFKARWGKEPKQVVVEHDEVKVRVYEVNYGDDVVLNYASESLYGTPSELIEQQLNFTQCFNHYIATGKLFSIANRKYLVLDNGKVCEFF